MTLGSLGKQGKIEYSKDGIQVWVKLLHNGDIGILILNRNSTAGRAGFPGKLHQAGQ